MKPNPQLQAALASHQAGREARGPGTGAGVASHALDAIGYILEYLDASERRWGGEGGVATALARDIVHAYRTDPDDDEQRDVNLENRIASALRNAGRKDSELLPTDPDAERIVDELVARRTANTVTRPLSRTIADPVRIEEDPAGGDGNDWEGGARDMYERAAKDVREFVCLDRWEDIGSHERLAEVTKFRIAKAIGAQEEHDAAANWAAELKQKLADAEAKAWKAASELANAQHGHNGTRHELDRVRRELEKSEAAREEAERKVKALSTYSSDGVLFCGACGTGLGDADEEPIPSRGA